MNSIIPISDFIIKVGEKKNNLSKTRISLVSGIVIKSGSVFYSYQDVYYDIDGWADCKLFLPEDYDLVYMRLARDKTIPGWIVGKLWIGYRLKEDDIVLYWKRKDKDDWRTT